MKKLLTIYIVFLLFSCKSVDNWTDSPVLKNETIKYAQIYISELKIYNSSIIKRENININDNTSIVELDNQFKLEKSVALSYNNLLRSWYDFMIVLKQDPGYRIAYKGHYYFRKAIDSLSYSSKIKKYFLDKTLKENKILETVLNIENECMLSIAEIVVYNNTLYDTESFYKQLKKIYKSID